MSHNHPFRRLASIALVAVAALGSTTACTKDAPAGNTAAAAPGSGAPEAQTVTAAQAAAQTVFDRFSAGDFAGAWDMYTTAGQAAISQADYVKLNEACSRKGLAITVSSARLQNPTTAIVIAKQLVATQSYTMLYQQNAWRLQPAKEGIALYKLGAIKAIAAQKKAGTCAGTGS